MPFLVLTVFTSLQSLLSVVEQDGKWATQSSQKNAQLYQMLERKSFIVTTSIGDTQICNCGQFSLPKTADATGKHEQAISSGSLWQLRTEAGEPDELERQLHWLLKTLCSSSKPDCSVLLECSIFDTKSLPSSRVVKVREHFFYVSLQINFCDFKHWNTVCYVINWIAFSNLGNLRTLETPGPLYTMATELGSLIKLPNFR